MATYKIALNKEQVDMVVNEFLLGKANVRIKGSSVNIENPHSFIIYSITNQYVLSETQGTVAHNILKYKLLLGKEGKLSPSLLVNLGDNVTDLFTKGKDWGDLKKAQEISLEKHTPQKKIFISHSSEDEKIAKLFVDIILILGLGVSSYDIFCTSIEGSGVKSGEDFKARIKKELVNSTAVIQLISSSYKESEVCLNEMGAAWVLSDRIIPIIIPPMNYDVGFLHTNTHQVFINNYSHLIQIYDDHKESLFASNNFSLNRFSSKVNEFIEALKHLIQVPEETIVKQHDLPDDGIIDTHKLSASDINAQFIDSVKAIPIIAEYITCNNKEYIIGVYDHKNDGFSNEQKLSVINLFANRWQIQFNKSLDDFNSNARVIKSEVIYLNKVPLVYLEREITQVGTMWQGSGTLEFGVFDPIKNDYYFILYHGHYRNAKLEGEFDLKEFETKGVPEYLSVLEEKAGASECIYITPKNYDINAFENYLEKWQIDNRSVYSDETGWLRFFYYEENLFTAGIYDYAESDTKENGYYKLAFCFAGPIVGLDKQQNRYFVVWIPEGLGGGGSWGVRSINKLEFLSAHEIQAQNSYEGYKIDLTSGNYTRFPVEDN